MSPQRLNDKHPRAWAPNNVWVWNDSLCVSAYN